MSNQELAADFLIIGAGMAGLTAAARASADGARVVLVEKGPTAGGSALYAGDVWTAASYDAMRAAHPDGDPERPGVLVYGIGPGLDWIRSLDVAVGEPVTVLG